MMASWLMNHHHDDKTMSSKTTTSSLHHDTLIRILSTGFGDESPCKVDLWELHMYRKYVATTSYDSESYL
jgi:hypothetical protein